MDFTRVPKMKGAAAQQPQRPIVNDVVAPPLTVTPKGTRRRGAKAIRITIRPRVLIIGTCCLVVVAGLTAYWLLLLRKPAVTNPFTTKIMASVQFPLYYPTKLPAGYKVDTSSVSEPQQGVVVFNMLGPKGEKMYMSEEARSATFNYGGFYKQWDNLKEVGVSDGAIAVGRLKNSRTEVASHANNKTWVLSNTNANIPLDQLTAMMKSLTLSY